MFAEAYQDYLRKYIELKNAVPSHDTINRVMGLVSPELLDKIQIKGQIITSDGCSREKNGKG